MKYLMLMGFVFISFGAFSAPLDDCDKPNQPDHYYEVCPIKVLITGKSKIEGEEELLISGKMFEVKYYASLFTETKKQGALTLSTKKNVKVNKLDINLRFEDCDQKNCNLSDYKEHLQHLVGDISIFFKAMVGNANRKKIEDNLKNRLLELDHSISFSDITTAVDLFLKASNKPVFFKFLNPHGNVIAYIRADIDLNGYVKLSEFIYRVVEGNETSWLGNRDYDLNASDAMWDFLWERQLRRVKRCVNTIVQVRNMNGNLESFPSTQCWYLYN